LRELKKELKELIKPKRNSTFNLSIENNEMFEFSCTDFLPEQENDVVKIFEKYLNNGFLTIFCKEGVKNWVPIGKKAASILVLLKEIGMEYFWERTKPEWSNNYIDATIEFDFSHEEIHFIDDEYEVFFKVNKENVIKFKKWAKKIEEDGKKMEKEMKNYLENSDLPIKYLSENIIKIGKRRFVTRIAITPDNKYVYELYTVSAEKLISLQTKNIDEIIQKAKEKTLYEFKKYRLETIF
jgi:hypothetical protein